MIPFFEFEREHCKFTTTSIDPTYSVDCLRGQCGRSEGGIKRSTERACSHYPTRRSSGGRVGQGRPRKGQFGENESNVPLL